MEDGLLFRQMSQQIFTLLNRILISGATAPLLGLYTSAYGRNIDWLVNCLSALRESRTFQTSRSCKSLPALLHICCALP